MAPEGRLIYSQVRSTTPPTRHLVKCVDVALSTSGRIRTAGPSSMGGVLYRLSYAGVGVVREGFEPPISCM